LTSQRPASSAAAFFIIPGVQVNPVHKAFLQAISREHDLRRSGTLPFATAATGFPARCCEGRGGGLFVLRLSYPARIPPWLALVTSFW